MNIPENSVVFNRNISIGGVSQCDPLRLVQYDDTLPVLAASLWIDGVKYKPPSGSTIRIRWSKPDGTGAYNPSLGVDEDGVVYVQITQQMTAAHGVGFGNLEITTAEGVKNSDAIPFVVAKNAVQEGQIESSDQWLSVDEILKRVESLQAKVEKDASTAATDAQRAVTAREAAETAAETVKQIVAGNEAYTKQESLDTFAQALKTDTGKGTSHEIYPDAGSNIVVTAYGYTQQEGSGDPSPENVRSIHVAQSVSVQVGDETFSPDLTEPLCDGDYVTSNKDGQCVDEHNAIYLEVDNRWVPRDVYTDTTSGDYLAFAIPQSLVVDTSIFPTTPSTGVCSHASYGNVYYAQEKSLFFANGKNGIPASLFSFRLPLSLMVPYGYDYDNPSTIKTAFPAYAQAQKDAGTPIQIVLRMTKPEPTTYTHAPVPLIARPDATGKVTVSGEREVSAVYNKSISKAFEELSAAILKLGGAQNV